MRDAALARRLIGLRLRIAVERVLAVRLELDLGLALRLIGAAAEKAIEAHERVSCEGLPGPATSGVTSDGRKLTRAPKPA